MNAYQLELKIASKGISKRQLSEMLNVNYQTFLRKLNNQYDFKLGEVKKIKEILQLKNDDIIEIFFGGLRHEL